jgi:mRNA-degrading endonuclease YafQ of YafQ-DinJ toxin-antitoxin module
MNELPLLESERKDFKNKIRELQEEKELITTSVLQQVTRIINVSEDLTQEQRDSILNQIWKGYKEKTNEIG